MGGRQGGEGRASGECTNIYNTNIYASAVAYIDMLAAYNDELFIVGRIVYFWIQTSWVNACLVNARMVRKKWGERNGLPPGEGGG